MKEKRKDIIQNKINTLLNTIGDSLAQCEKYFDILEEALKKSTFTDVPHASTPITPGLMSISINECECELGNIDCLPPQLMMPKAVFEELVETRPPYNSLSIGGGGLKGV